MKENDTITAVKQWVETVIINLNLCPFAKKVYVNDQVRFAFSAAENEEDLLLHLHTELKLIEEDKSIKTTLLIHPFILNDFNAYNQFLAYADNLLEEMDLTGIYQIASFHPDYQFANTQVNDVENFTNRSPYPVLHIINEADVELAISTHPDIDSIPIRNEQLMRDLGPEKMQAILQACLA